MLVKTVNSPKGTAAKAKLTEKIVAGKTGTAREKLNNWIVDTADDIMNIRNTNLNQKKTIHKNINKKYKSTK